MTYLEKLAKAARDREWEGNDRKCDWEADDKAYWIASVRATLTAMRDCPIPVRHLTTFEFAEREWPKLIDVILNEPLSEG